MLHLVSIRNSVGLAQAVATVEHIDMHQAFRMQGEGLLARCGVNTHAAGCLALVTRGAACLEVSPLLHLIRVCLYVCQVPDNKACTHLGHALDALNLPGAEETANVC